MSSQSEWLDVGAPPELACDRVDRRWARLVLKSTLILYTRPAWSAMGRFLQEFTEAMLTTEQRLEKQAKKQRKLQTK